MEKRAETDVKEQKAGPFGTETGITRQESEKRDLKLRNRRNVEHRAESDVYAV